MGQTRKQSVVDSYTAIRAAQRAVKSRPAANVTAAAPGLPKDELQELGAQVRQAAIPSKQLIECYECGYRFQLHGRVPKTNCNKCRAILDLTDYAIAKRWSGTIKTTGTVRIDSDGVLERGSIVAGDVILEGEIESAIVRATRKLELHQGARFPESNLKAADLLVASGATIELNEPAEYRDVEIAGSLRANLRVAGIFRLRITGRFEGKLRTSRLVVEEGAECYADVSANEEPH